MAPGVLSLFAGAGGDSLGMQHAGFRLVAFVECAKHPAASHAINLPGCARLAHPVRNPRGDITAMPDAVFESLAKTVDVVTATFPCQPFSAGGKRARGDELAADDRSQLYRQFIRVTKLMKPTAVIGENVPKLLESEMWPRIVAGFAAIGYTLTARVLDAADFDVPQRRRRLLMVGMPFGSDFDWSAVKKVAGPRPAVRAVLQPSLRDAYEVLPTERHLLPDGWEARVVEFGELRPEPGALLRRECKIGAYLGRRQIVVRGRARGVDTVHLQDPDAPSHTITRCSRWNCKSVLLIRAADGRLFLRRFTVDEAQAIMGFPSQFRLSGTNEGHLFDQLGNAVPPQLFAAVGRALLAQSFGAKRSQF